jgi:histidine triad (HIT) family protein
VLAQLGRLGFGLARSGLLDPVVRCAFAFGAPVLPVHRLRLERSVIAFFHPRPTWPTHVLLVPRRSIASYGHVRADNVGVVGDLFRIAPGVADTLKLGKGGYSLLLNGGARQDVGQLHVHLIAPPLDVAAGADLCPVAAPDLALDAELLSFFGWLRPVVRARRLDHTGFSVLAPRGSEGGVYLVG